MPTREELEQPVGMVQIGFNEPKVEKVLCLVHICVANVT